ncbi:unnamed protein product [Ilex paraguariensis]|uniref:Amine oxidase n=1 Tax=Ilex paraguariensis TaxID=185542 RepID=A0ABC8S6L5_9AQUA
MASNLEIILFFFSLLLIFTLISTQQYHPLDPLTESELHQVQTIVKEANSIPHHNLTFNYVSLDEPDKPVVLSWLSNQPTKNPPRKALVIARIDHKTHEIIVDLQTNSISSDKIYHGCGFPIITFEEQEAANDLPFTYPPFMASIRRRGLKLEEVVCVSYTVGWFGEKTRPKRIVKVQCYYMDGTANLYMRPIEAITVTVDIDVMKIVGYRDRSLVPVPKADGTEYRRSSEKSLDGAPLKGITVRQPEGPSFTIDGHTVR